MLEGQLDVELVLRALLLATLKGMEVSERIEILKSAGWTDSQIGGAVGLTANAVKKRRGAKKGKA